VRNSPSLNIGLECRKVFGKSSRGGEREGCRVTIVSPFKLCVLCSCS